MLNVYNKEEKSEDSFMYDFYCAYCKKYFSDDEIKKKIINQNSIGHSILKYCPLCDSKDLISVCDSCHDGLMKKSIIPFGGDYNLNGTIDPFCDECGEGYEHIIISFCRIMIKADLSKRRIRRIVDKVFTHKKLPYQDKKRVEQIIFNDTSEGNVIKVLTKECNENETFIKGCLRE